MENNDFKLHFIKENYPDLVIKYTTLIKWSNTFDDLEWEEGENRTVQIPSFSVFKDVDVIFNLKRILDSLTSETIIPLGTDVDSVLHPLHLGIKRIDDNLDTLTILLLLATWLNIRHIIEEILETLKFHFLKLEEISKYYDIYKNVIRSKYSHAHTNIINLMLKLPVIKDTSQLLSIMESIIADTTLDLYDRYQLALKYQLTVPMDNVDIITARRLYSLGVISPIIKEEAELIEYTKSVVVNSIANAWCAERIPNPVNKLFWFYVEGIDVDGRVILGDVTVPASSDISTSNSVSTGINTYTILADSTSLFSVADFNEDILREIPRDDYENWDNYVDAYEKSCVHVTEFINFPSKVSLEGENTRFYKFLLYQGLLTEEEIKFMERKDELQKVITSYDEKHNYFNLRRECKNISYTLNNILSNPDVNISEINYQISLLQFRLENEGAKLHHQLKENLLHKIQDEKDRITYASWNRKDLQSEYTIVKKESEDADIKYRTKLELIGQIRDQIFNDEKQFYSTVIGKQIQQNRQSLRINFFRSNRRYGGLVAVTQTFRVDPHDIIYSITDNRDIKAAILLNYIKTGSFRSTSRKTSTIYHHVSLPIDLTPLNEIGKKLPMMYVRPGYYRNNGTNIIQEGLFRKYWKYFRYASELNENGEIMATIKISRSGQHKIWLQHGDSKENAEDIINAANRVAIIDPLYVENIDLVKAESDPRTLKTPAVETLAYPHIDPKLYVKVGLISQRHTHNVTFQYFMGIYYVMSIISRMRVTK